MAEDKLRCPFCGQAAQIEERESVWQKKNWFAIRCTNRECPGHPKDPYECDTKDKIIRAWNRRPSHDEE